jgi:hypothetical protein
MRGANSASLLYCKVYTFRSRSSAFYYICHIVNMTVKLCIPLTKIIIKVYNIYTIKKTKQTED